MAAPTSRTALGCIIYADPKSRVEFSAPQSSALVREIKRVFGDGVTIRFALSEDVRSGRAFDDNAHIFVLPGIFGQDSLYPAHIGEEGNAHIRRFVENGGLFLGLCAGAYYAASDILYTPEWGHKRERRGGNLGLFNGLAYGPLPGYGRDTNATPKTAHDKIIHIDPVPVLVNADTLAGTRVHLAYGLGPGFVIDENQSHVAILARYDSVEGKPPAVLEIDYGRGKAILSGVLPQFGQEENPAPYAGTLEQSLVRLLHTLYEGRHGRTAFWNMLMQRVARHHNHRLTP